MTDALRQRQDALARANTVRFARSAVKRDLAARETTIVDVIDLDCVQGMRVGQLLGAQHMWGPKRVREALLRVPCSEWARVGELTDRQRAALLEAVTA